jgi:DNA-binding response OmpR family regulator
MIKRILFVEDETHIAELYAMVLRKDGYEVDVETDGAAGYETARKGNYDLILLDLMLPTMPGIEILHDLRDPIKNPGFASMVVVLTNLGEDTLTVRDIKKYAQGYLLKVDVTPRQLADYIRALGQSQHG